MTHAITQRYDQLTAALKQLSDEQVLVFSLDCAERVFHFIEVWSGQDGMLSILASEALDYVKQGGRDAAALNQQIIEIENALPHTEDSDTVSPSGALDATLSLLGLLKCALEPSVENAQQAAAGAIGAYDITGFYRDDSGVEPDYLLRDLHPTAIVEWERQQDLISALLK